MELKFDHMHQSNSAFKKDVAIIPRMSSLHVIDQVGTETSNFLQAEEGVKKMNERS
jgi:hypothetical protein